MSLSLLLVLVVIFSFAVGRILTRSAARFVTLSGTEYVLVGVLIGPQFTWNLLSAEALQAFEPFISLLLGLAGFVLGLRTRRALGDASSAAAGVGSVLGVIAISAACLLPLVEWLTDSPRAGFVVSRPVLRVAGYVVELHFSSDAMWTALVLGCVAGTVSTALVTRVCEASRASGRVTRFALTGSAVAQNVSVIIFGLTLSSMRAASVESALRLTVVEWAVTAAGAAIVIGLLFTLFIGREEDPGRVFLATIGLVTFASGVGVALEISPLFINLLAGITVAATSNRAERVREHLDRLQHPLFVLITIFAGAHWLPTSGWLWLLPGAYVAVRILGGALVTPLMARLFMQEGPRGIRLGRAFLSQGTMAIAIGLNDALWRPDHAPIVLTTVLVGVFACDLFSDRILSRVLADAGETDRAPSPSSEEEGKMGSSSLRAAEERP